MREGWQNKRLGDVCDFKGGGTPSKAVDRFWQGDIPWVSPKDMKSQVIDDSMDHISQEAVAASATSMIEVGAVLMVVRSGILARTVPIALAGRTLAMNQDLKALCPRPSIDSWFLYYLLEAKMSELLALVSRGATVHRLITDQIRAIEFMLPPLPEQRRIVAILDEAFEGIATAKANAEKNLQNARELFTSHLERVFGQRGTDWHEAPLLSFASAISTGPFGSLLHKSDYVSDGVPLVNPINIVDGLIVPDPDKLIDPTTKQRLQSYVLREGDIVVGRRGEIGRCAVVGPTEAGWVCGTGCFFVRPLPTVRSAFIAHLIRSREYRARLERASTGTTMKNLSNTALGELHVAIPPITEQDRALALIGRLAEDCGRLEDVYERKLVALDELKKSLLHQAFTGALTAKSTDKQVAEVA